MSCQDLKQNMKHSTIYQEIVPSCCVPIVPLFGKPCQIKISNPDLGMTKPYAQISRKGCNKKGMLTGRLEWYLGNTLSFILTNHEWLFNMMRIQLYIFHQCFFWVLCDVFFYNYAFKVFISVLTSPIFTWVLFPTTFTEIHFDMGSHTQQTNKRCWYTGSSGSKVMAIQWDLSAEFEAGAAQTSGFRRKWVTSTRIFSER